MAEAPSLPRGLRAADDATCTEAREMLSRQTTAALSTLDPKDGNPVISQIAVQYMTLGEGPRVVAFLSNLARHTRALTHRPACALLLQESRAKGDPMTWPRLMLRATAQPARLDAQADQALRKLWLTRQPKAAIWLGLADFRPWVFELSEATLNAGFGKAFVIPPAALSLP